MTDSSIFSNLTFQRFRELARDPLRSRHEKVGFPDNYREGREEDIFSDVATKLANLQCLRQKVLEIGPGCSRLPVMLAQRLAEHESTVTFVDSAEMLALLPDGPHIHKVAGAFPQALESQFESLRASFDVIVAYSVVQYVFAEGNLWNFFDRCLALLAEGGELLLGDLPNQIMRQRLFASSTGRRLHREYTGRDEPPPAPIFDAQQMDDSVVLSLLARARAQGFHAWVVPQSPALPMSNRREDILVRRP